MSTGGYKGMHGYHPAVPAMATGFIISGPEVRKKVSLPFVRMVDVAPTIAAVLGLDLKEASGFPMRGIWMKSKNTQVPPAEQETASP